MPFCVWNGFFGLMVGWNNYCGCTWDPMFGLSHLWLGKYQQAQGSTEKRSWEAEGPNPRGCCWDLNTQFCSEKTTIMTKIPQVIGGRKHPGRQAIILVVTWSRSSNKEMQFTKEASPQISEQAACATRSTRCEHRPRGTYRTPVVWLTENYSGQNINKRGAGNTPTGKKMD